MASTEPCFTTRDNAARSIGASSNDCGRYGLIATPRVTGLISHLPAADKSAVAAKRANPFLAFFAKNR
jgi:hypothetical protein